MSDWFASVVLSSYQYFKYFSYIELEFRVLEADSAVSQHLAVENIVPHFQNCDKIETTWKHAFVAIVMPRMTYNRSGMVEGRVN